MPPVVVLRCEIGGDMVLLHGCENGQFWCKRVSDNDICH